MVRFSIFFDQSFKIGKIICLATMPDCPKPPKKCLGILFRVPFGIGNQGILDDCMDWPFFLCRKLMREVTSTGGTDGKLGSSHSRNLVG